MHTQKRRVVLYEKAKNLDDWNKCEIDVLFAHPAATAYGLNMQQRGLMTIAMSYNAMLDAHDRVVEEGLFDTNRQGVSVPSGPFFCDDEYGLTSKASASLKRLDEGGEADDEPLTLLSKELQYFFEKSAEKFCGITKMLYLCSVKQSTFKN